jgi:zinc transport system ATP-binding protein
MTPGLGSGQTPILEVSGLTIVREGRAIVEDVGLRVARGAIHVIVGPNGGGKSSVVEALLGQASFTGSVRFAFAEAAHRIGYVPQSFPVDPTLPVTVLELLALSRQRLPVCLGVRRETVARVAALLERVGLPGLAARRLGALSGGELRRVLLAQAIDPVPELLFLDEPGSGLDPESVARLESVVRALRDDHGTTVVMVSHDVAQVRRLADAVTWIDRRVRREGTAEAVLAGTQASGLPDGASAALGIA